MGSDAFLLGLWLWLLPQMVTGRVLREVDGDTEGPCQTYTYNHLLHVDCADRGLTELPDNLDYDAHVLLLSNNNFALFPSQLEKFRQVMHLDLSSNHISHPLPTYFQEWQQLRTLNLSNNNYETWTSTDYPLYIHNLDLSKNKINNIDQDAFRNNPQLQSLDLSENRIYNIEPTTFANMKSLISLVLSRNFFSEVPSFQSQSLRNLFLSCCQIIDFNVNSLIGMNSLVSIDLSMNELEVLPDNLESETLQELYLSYNELSILTDLTFSSLPHLAVLDLRGNEFKEVWSTTHFASNPYLREVYVKGNRWSCEGFSVNLLLTYEYFTKEPAKVADPAALICYSPSEVAQLSWQQAYIQMWHPNDSTTEYFTTFSLLIGIIIGIVLTSMVCRFCMSVSKSEPPRPPATPDTVILNNNNTQPRVESVIMRIPLRDEDLPPSYDEALLMPQLGASFHSLPDFLDEEEEETSNRYRRSRSIGDLTEYRPRRSARHTIDIHRS